jgi:hypothetical protein
LTDAPGQIWSGRTLDDVELDLDLREAWRKDDADLERDAVDFWNRTGILPQGVSPEERAKELAAIAYQDGSVAAVATAALLHYEPLRARFAFFRCAVDPARRRGLISTAITVFARDAIERWAAAHPEEKVAGLAAIIESADLQQRARAPCWPQTRLNLVAFTPEGRQVRVAWFDRFAYD